MHGLFRLQRCSWICLTPFVRFAKHQPVVVTSMSLSSLSMLSCGQILAMPQPFSHEVQCTQCTHETKQTTLSRRKITAHFQGRHDVFIHCFHHFLQATIRTHWLILLASYFEFKTKNIMKHLFSTNVHSIIHTNGCM